MSKNTNKPITFDVPEEDTHKPVTSGTIRALVEGKYLVNGRIVELVVGDVVLNEAMVALPIVKIEENEDEDADEDCEGCE